MTAANATPESDLINPAAILGDVEAHLIDFLHGKAQQTAGHRSLGEMIEVLSDFLLAGGKRIRPVLCVLGWHAAGGEGSTAGVVGAAAALEMFHAFALVHDDVMDDSALRRGHPTVHVALAARHADREDAQRLGVSGAILLGDLALAWSDELLHTAQISRSQLVRVLPFIDLMRAEVTYGQYLDLLATGRPSGDLRRALEIIRFKTAKYTVERPLHIGAALGGGGEPVLEALSAYALPIGEAFQLRDDLLGVFGDPQTTGKPSMDDLREGKHTALMALALGRLGATASHILRELLDGPEMDEDRADKIRRILVGCGARDGVEEMIKERLAKATAVLDQDPFPGQATAMLRELALKAAMRTA